MQKYIVTVKMRTEGHDPKNKVTDQCPREENGICTDKTGAHHSLLVESDLELKDILFELGLEFVHITRIERVEKIVEVT